MLNISEKVTNPHQVGKVIPGQTEGAAKTSNGLGKQGKPGGPCRGPTETGLGLCSGGEQGQRIT